MNFKKILVLFMMFLLTCANKTFASKLPDDVWNFVKKSLPQAQQRFDSVITLTDSTMYIPLYPPSTVTVDDIKIEYTYPSNKKLSDYPEVVLLNNGYSLLKVTKDNNGNYSLTKKDDLPVKVRLGIMPQDMLTPAGLKMPESLKLTLGDLLIPSKSETNLVLSDEEKEKTSSFNPTVKRSEFVSAVDFQNKKIYINPKNSKFIEVFDNSSNVPLYELKLSSMPLKIVTSPKYKVALITYWTGKNVEIIDLTDERIISTIELEANATDVVINTRDNIAYVASSNAKTIYVIDLSKMELKRGIKLDQNPTKLAFSESDNSLCFYDEYSSKVYQITTNPEQQYVVQPMGTVENASKIVSDVANIYALSRTGNSLYIFDKTSGKQIANADLDKKPADAVIYNNKLYVLCSKEGYLDVYDVAEQKIISREKIAKDGFYSKITLLEDEKNLLITGMNSNSYLIYSLDKMKVVRKQESDVDVANIFILDKVQKL